MMIDLTELRSSCEKRNIPIISKPTESFLRDILEKRKPKICMEIGGAVGYSALYMADIIDKWGGIFYSFEISYPGYREGIQNIKSATSRNIVTYPYNVLQVPIKKLVPAPVDFVFIDGQKSQYGEYMQILEKIVSPRTIIIIDDVIKYHNKLYTLYGYLQKKQINYQIVQLDPDDGVMVIGKDKLEKKGKKGI